MARPMKHEHEKRTEVIRARMTEAERDHVFEQAQRAGIKPSEYIRLRSLEYVVTPKPATADTELISQINMVGCNLHQFLRDDRFGRGTRTEADWNQLYDRLSSVLEKAAAAYGA
jgi:hypothetical protein